MADSSVQVRFSADIGQLIESIDQAKESLDGLGEGFRSLAELAGIGLSADAFKEWISASAEAGEQMVRMSAILGTSVPQVSELSAVAKLTGTDFDGLALAMERMQLKLTTAGRATSGVSQALGALGINGKAFAALGIPEQMDRLAVAFSHFADGPTKTAAAIELLGRNGAQMIPILDRGREGLEELRQAAQNSGAVMSTETAESFEKTKEDLSELSLAATGFSNRLFSNVNPAIDATIKYLGRMLEAANPGALGSALNEFVADLARLTKSVAEFAQNAIGWLDKLNSWGDKVANVLNAVNAASTNLGQTIHNSVVGVSGSDRAALAGNAIAGNASGGATLDRAKTLGDLFESDLTTGAKDAADALKRLGGVVEVHTGGKSQVPSFQTGGGRGQNDALRAAEVEANEEVKLAQDAAKQRELILNEELKTKQISNTEWLTATKDALQDELQDTLSVYSQEEQLAGLKGSQIAALKAKEAEAIERYNQQILQAEIKTTEAIAQQYTKLGDTIVGAFNSQLRGLLAGTTSWKTAMQNIGADLVLKLIEYFDKMAVEWIAKQFAMTTASIAGDTARTASSATAAATTAATQSTGLFATLAADAAKVFGGVFAFLSPILGPAAAGPAAASEAAVLGAGASIASAAVGGYVLSSGLANIHAGETIVPASLSQPYQGGGAGHTWNIAINGSGLTPQQIVGAIQQNVDAITGRISRAMNNNLSLRPSY